MTKDKIIEQTYEDIIALATKVLFQELMNDNHNGWHAQAERRFVNGLKAAELARDRAKKLLAEVK